jgi:hypothetical protein
MPRKPKLSDLQLVVMAKAATRGDRHLLPLPQSITDDDRTRAALNDLRKRKLAVEMAITGRGPYWRTDGDLRFGLALTAAGCAAIGLDEGGGEAGQADAGDALEAVRADVAAAGNAASPGLTKRAASRRHRCEQSARDGGYRSQLGGAGTAVPAGMSKGTRQSAALDGSPCPVRCSMIRPLALWIPAGERGELPSPTCSCPPRPATSGACL